MEEYLSQNSYKCNMCGHISASSIACPECEKLKLMKENNAILKGESNRGNLISGSEGKQS
jgi:DNA-directed RNA polymerase subunit RPC12/RpoP